MGGGTYSAATSAAFVDYKLRSGTTFAYDTTVRSTGKYEVHESLDPKKLNAAGNNVRECFDSLEHPKTKPMVIGLDQTGSMGSIPRDLQTKLKSVFGMTVDKGVEDVQISVAAYGDATNGEHMPLQISQFESDNRIDEALDNFFLEGMGGGNGGETSNLLFYYLTYHTQLDCWDRGEKGKFYMIADERQVPITADIVKKYIGDESPLGSLDFNDLADALSEKYDVTILLINNAAAKWQNSETFYSDLFGPDNVVIVESVQTIPELIAGLFAYDLGRSIDSVVEDLTVAAGKDVALTVSRTLAQRDGSKHVALR